MVGISSYSSRYYAGLAEKNTLGDSRLAIAMPRDRRTVPGIADAALAAVIAKTPPSQYHRTSCMRAGYRGSGNRLFR